MKILSNEFTDESYKKYFNKWSFDLSTFQKWAINGIVEEKNVLITAHTGSGKTLPAEFAIDYFPKKNKKVIYTKATFGRGMTLIPSRILLSNNLMKMVNFGH